MKRTFKFAVFAFLLFLNHMSMAQGIVGKWKTVDDVSGKPRSVVEIFERDGKVHGRILRLYREPGEDQDPTCVECDEHDPRYRKKIVGMEILSNMIKDDDEYDDGEILDPKNGKIYSCKLWLEGKDLKVRGYLGPFFRTQTWHRAE